MDRAVPDESRQPRVKKQERQRQTMRLRQGGSITLPAGATEEDIDNALRLPAAEEESK